VAGEGRLNQPDGIHPNEEGARRVATTVWRALQPLVATTGATTPLAASAAAGSP
jgi:acyl-CoA thioesterase-1